MNEMRRVWAMGDYDAFARETVWVVGPIVAGAAGAAPGVRLLDVAAGSGNVALRAAEVGAEVVASDLTPENMEPGKRAAAELGLAIEWVEADAEDLPFADGEFDAVASCFGAIFAPRHQRVADEMLRVCKPGGRIAMANFAADGLLGPFFEVFAPYMPPPREGDLPPGLWGDPDHLRELFGDRVASLEITRRSYIERAASPAAYCELFKRTFGPVTATYAALADDPDRAAELDRAFLGFAESANEATDGSCAVRFDYYLVVAVKS